MGFNSGTDLLKTQPGEGPPAVVMLQKLRALPAVGSGGLYEDLIKRAKVLPLTSLRSLPSELMHEMRPSGLTPCLVFVQGIVFLSTWKAGVIYVGGQVRVHLCA